MSCVRQSHQTTALEELLHSGSPSWNPVVPIPLFCLPMAMRPLPWTDLCTIIRVAPWLRSGDFGKLVGSPASPHSIPGRNIISFTSQNHPSMSNCCIESNPRQQYEWFSNSNSNHPKPQNYSLHIMQTPVGCHMFSHKHYTRTTFCALLIAIVATSFTNYTRPHSGSHFLSLHRFFPSKALVATFFAKRTTKHIYTRTTSSTFALPHRSSPLTIRGLMKAVPAGVPIPTPMPPSSSSGVAKPESSLGWKVFFLSFFELFWCFLGGWRVLKGLVCVFFGCLEGLFFKRIVVFRVPTIQRDPSRLFWCFWRNIQVGSFGFRWFCPGQVFWWICVWVQASNAWHLQCIHQSGWHHVMCT